MLDIDAEMDQCNGGPEASRLYGLFLLLFLFLYLYLFLFLFEHKSVHLPTQDSRCKEKKLGRTHGTRCA